MSGGVAAVIAAALVVGIGVVGTGVTGALAVPAAGGEFTVSGVGTNNQIAPGPDGNMWVTLDSGGKDVARITPAGTVDEFDVSNVSSPTGITAGPDGNLWVTQSGGVARFSPADPTTGTATPIADISDPRAITLGPDGNLWTASGDKVIRIPPAAPATFQSSGATGVQGARWIAAGTDGVWVADFGGSQVVHVTTAGAGTAYPTGTGGGPQGVAFGGGLAGYADPGTTPQTVGRIASGGTPAPTQVPNTDPFGMAYGADGAFWFAEFLTDSVGRLAADGTVTTLALTPGSGPRQLSAGPGDTLWVTLDTAEKVARITGVTPAPTATKPPAPGTTITTGPRKVVRTSKARARVVFRFTSNVSGATFRCRLGSAPFRSCTSPKAYRLKPGRYTFKVRAVAGGVLDSTPATRTFRIVRR